MARENRRFGGLDCGVYLNLGSAVVLPEVFLKALNLARNVTRRPIDRFVAAPAPLPTISGIMPATRAIVVIKIGRKRSRFA